MQKRTLDLILIGLFILLAVLLYYSTASFPKFAQKTTANYIRFLALATGLFSIIQLYLTLKTIENKQKLKWMSHPPRFIMLFIALLVYAVILAKIGFFVSTGIFIPVTALLLGHRRPIAIALTTILTLIFIYVVFVRLLSVHLPQGLLL